MDQQGLLVLDAQAGGDLRLAVRLVDPGIRVAHQNLRRGRILADLEMGHPVTVGIERFGALDGADGLQDGFAVVQPVLLERRKVLAAVQRGLSVHQRCQVRVGHQLVHRIRQRGGEGIAAQADRRAGLRSLDIQDVFRLELAGKGHRCGAQGRGVGLRLFFRRRGKNAEFIDGLLDLRLRGKRLLGDALDGLLQRRVHRVVDFLHGGGNGGVAQQRHRAVGADIDARGIQLNMAVLHGVIARYQVKVISVDADHEVAGLVPGLNLQGDVLCLRVGPLHKPAQYIGLAKASHSRWLCEGARNGEKHHDDQQAGNKLLHNVYPFHHSCLAK